MSGVKSGNPFAEAAVSIGRYVCDSLVALCDGVVQFSECCGEGSFVVCALESKFAFVLCVEVSDEAVPFIERCSFVRFEG